MMLFQSGPRVSISSACSNATARFGNEATDDIIGDRVPAGTSVDGPPLKRRIPLLPSSSRAAGPVQPCSCRIGRRRRLAGEAELRPVTPHPEKAHAHAPGKRGRGALPATPRRQAQRLGLQPVRLPAGVQHRQRLTLRCSPERTAAVRRGAVRRLPRRLRPCEGLRVPYASARSGRAVRGAAGEAGPGGLRLVRPAVGPAACVLMHDMASVPAPCHSLAAPESAPEPRLDLILRPASRHAPGKPAARACRFGPPPDVQSAAGLGTSVRPQAHRVRCSSAEPAVANRRSPSAPGGQ